MTQSRPRVAARMSACVLSVQSDERLVALFRAGHEAAFEVLVRRHRRPLLAYCRRFLPDSAGEDVVQHAFLSAYRALPEMEGDLHFRAWLYRIASNRAIDVLRARPPLDADSDAHLDRIAAPDAYDSHERLAEVVAALQALPSRQRDALVLQEFDGRSHQEIAARIGVTEGAVRQLIHRARAGLRAGVAALVPFGVLDALVRAPRADAFVARRLCDLVSAGTGSAAATKATVAVVTVAGLGGVATTTAVRAGDDRPERVARVTEHPRIAETAIVQGAGTFARVEDEVASRRPTRRSAAGRGDSRRAGRDRRPFVRLRNASVAPRDAPVAGAGAEEPQAADDRRSPGAPARERPKAVAPEEADDRDEAEDDEAPETPEPADEPAEGDDDADSVHGDAPDVEADETHDTDEADPGGGVDSDRSE